MQPDRLIAEWLERARLAESRGLDEPAKSAYLELLRLDPTHRAALHELGNLAWAMGHRSAALTACRQLVKCHPNDPVGRANLANLLYQNGDLAQARIEYEAALAADADLAAAHQGLARTLTALGETAAAQPHWERGFIGHALVRQRYRGTGVAVRALLLVSVRQGNVPTRRFLDDRVFEVIAVYAEFWDPAQPLPPHAIVFNAIGDADLCPLALARAETLLARTRAPVINPPERVRGTGRVENARRLARLPGVIAPAMRAVTRSGLQSDGALGFPLLLRTPGFHTGRNFVRVERREALAAAAAALPGDELLAIEFLDARGPDGMTRKYRVMIVDGALYPLHLAIASGWKVHYFSSDMDTCASHREEERRFLEEMPAVLGPGAMSALVRIGEHLGLDYGGIDFGLGRDGSVLLFEANATMVILPPDPDPKWDYRRAPTERALEAVRGMLLRRAMPAEACGS
jgi:hypothetical protein